MRRPLTPEVPGMGQARNQFYFILIYCGSRYVEQQSYHYLEHSMQCILKRTRWGSLTLFLLPFPTFLSRSTYNSPYIIEKD